MVLRHHDQSREVRANSSDPVAVDPYDGNRLPSRTDGGANASSNTIFEKLHDDNSFAKHLRKKEDLVEAEPIPRIETRSSKSPNGHDVEACERVRARSQVLRLREQRVEKGTHVRVVPKLLALAQDVNDLKLLGSTAGDEEGPAKVIEHRPSIEQSGVLVRRAVRSRCDRARPRGTRRTGSAPYGTSACAGAA